MGYNEPVRDECEMILNMIFNISFHTLVQVVLNTWTIS